MRPAQLPMVDYLVLGDEPHLVAQECASCRATFFDRRNACAKCGAREFAPKVVADTGVVRTFTIVHRAAKGVPAPYVSAVIDLDSGDRVKSNVVNVAAKPEDVALGMKVKLTTYVTATDDEGTDAIAFGYEPAA